MHNLIGFLGTVLILVAYYCLQTGRIVSDQLIYLLLNLFGASFVVFSLCFEFNFSAFVVESAWVVISLIGLARFVRNKSKRVKP